jgi:hypothetical protein
MDNNNTKNKKSHFKKTLLYTFILTIISTVISFISYQGKNYILLVLINPVVVFFDPDFTVDLFMVIPGTFIYYLIIITVLRFSIGRIKLNLGIKKFLYILLFLLPILLHVFITFIGMVTVLLAS